MNVERAEDYTARTGRVPIRANIKSPVLAHWWRPDGQGSLCEGHGRAAHLQGWRRR